MRLALFAAFAACAFSQPAIVHRATVYQHPSSDPYDPLNRTGFNHAANIVHLGGPRLMAAWFSGPFEASVHQLILATYSSDEGKTWSPAEVFHDVPRTSDFDPAFLLTPGRLWLFFSTGRWNRYPFTMNDAEKVGERSFQIHARTSLDSGRSWTPASTAQVERGFNCRNNGIRLSTGELLLPLAQLRGNESGVLRSADDGRTWSRHGRIHTPQGQDEPTIVELQSGAVLMFLRTGGGTLWKTLSRDKGLTWSEPQNTALVAARSSHSLFRLRDGRIVLTHNASPNRRTPLTLRISSDDAATWGPPLTLAEAPTEPVGPAGMLRQVSYPSVAQLDNGDLYVVWSDIGIAETNQYGDIAAARVRLP